MSRYDKRPDSGDDSGPCHQTKTMLVIWRLFAPTRHYGRMENMIRRSCQLMSMLGGLPHQIISPLFAVYQWVVRATQT